MNNKIHLDPYLFISISMLSFIGLFILFSASESSFGAISRQLIYIVLGFFLFFIFSQPDPDIYRRFSLLFLILSLFLVASTYFIGTEINGAKRWLKFYVFSFQPSELLKLALPLFLSSYLFHKKLPISFKDTLIAILFIFACFLIVARQPDLGTALLVTISGIFVLFLAGLSWLFIFLCLSAIAVFSPFIWNNLLQPFQKDRIWTLFNPESDPYGAGWNIIQSKIAVGSGGIFGKGYGQGSQTQLNFLPETQTDFIFSVLAEEFGFVGVLLLVMIYAFVLLRCFYLAVNARDRFCRLVIGGFIFTFCFNVFVNLAMVVGLIPVVGMPLPFFSRGGTSLLSLFIMFGIITSMASHKKFMQR